MLDIKQNKTKTNKNPKAKTEQDNSNNKHSHIIKRKRFPNLKGSLRQSNDLAFGPSIKQLAM